MTEKPVALKPYKIIVESELRRIMRENGMNKEESLGDALEAKVRALVAETIMRAKLNGRRTVMARDV